MQNILLYILILLSYIHSYFMSIHVEKKLLTHKKKHIVIYFQHILNSCKL